MKPFRKFLQHIATLLILIPFFKPNLFNLRFRFSMFISNNRYLGFIQFLSMRKSQMANVIIHSIFANKMIVFTGLLVVLPDEDPDLVVVPHLDGVRV